MLMIASRQTWLVPNWPYALLTRNGSAVLSTTVGIGWVAVRISWATAYKRRCITANINTSQSERWKTVPSQISFLPMCQLPLEPRATAHAILASYLLNIWRWIDRMPLGSCYNIQIPSQAWKQGEVVSRTVITRTGSAGAVLTVVLRQRKTQYTFLICQNLLSVQLLQHLPIDRPRRRAFLPQSWISLSCLCRLLFITRVCPQLFSGSLRLHHFSRS